MVQQYAIAGRQVGSHVLAMITLGSLGGLSYAFLGGSAAKKTTQGPPINAQSPDEESFIKCVFAPIPQQSAMSRE
ncbi:hypothetical protein LSUE1_G006216 [Lachnellula suecica]|uniref:Uncharacterized protein n=1 Tax=Lachnellula suecica TaxID=602035 RepID=A0A8T9C6B0_9HELO|nr:hypothetical protein LSUE1_G006216 [Lachnellula suecica]